jgi:hypothetical protein
MRQLRQPQHRLSVPDRTGLLWCRLLIQQSCVRVHHNHHRWLSDHYYIVAAPELALSLRFAPSPRSQLGHSKAGPPPNSRRSVKCATTRKTMPKRPHTTRSLIHAVAKTALRPNSALGLVLGGRQSGARARRRPRRQYRGLKGRPHHADSYHLRSDGNV